MAALSQLVIGQLALVEPDFEAGRAQGLANSPTPWSLRGRLLASFTRLKYVRSRTPRVGCMSHATDRFSYRVSSRTLYEWHNDS